MLSDMQEKLFPATIKCISLVDEEELRFGALEEIEAIIGALAVLNRIFHEDRNGVTSTNKQSTQCNHDTYHLNYMQNDYVCDLCGKEMGFDI